MRCRRHAGRVCRSVAEYRACRQCSGDSAAGLREKIAAWRYRCVGARNVHAMSIIHDEILSLYFSGCSYRDLR
jgi:hypothetical protein